QNRLAQTDGLTGLLNRTHLFAQTRDLLKADPRPRSVGIFLFDLDHFKHYNDTNGHLAGDQLLRQLSQLLREKTREDELVGRYGGEECLVVMPTVDRDQVLRAAERIRATIAATPFPHGDQQPLGCVSISGGVSVWPMDGDNLETLVKRADMALYAAKGGGRNRVYGDAMLELDPGTESTRIAEATADALREDLQASFE